MKEIRQEKRNRKKKSENKANLSCSGLGAFFVLFCFDFNFADGLMVY